MPFVEFASRRSALVAVLAAAAALHLLLLIPLPLAVQAPAALVLTGLLPGYLLVEWLVGGRPTVPLEAWERWLYSIGAGAATIVVGMLLLSYLPGPILGWQVLVVSDAWTVLMGLLVLRRPAVPADQSAPRAALAEWPPVWSTAPRGWLVAGLAVLLLVASFMRLPNLGYSEFQGDETRALLRTAEAIQGYSDALMTHKKAPAEILLPASAYVLAGRITEATARLPFTLLNLTGLFAIFLLGWRLFGPVAGWAAAMILALDGYFIGFARIVQYQSIVFCMAVLVVLVLYRLVRSPRLLPNYLTLAAIFMATGLLAHYEGALAVLPALFLLYTLWRQGVSLAALARALVVPVVVGALLLAAFYVPFVLNPSFRTTYAYITVNRIGTTFPYNNLVDVFSRTMLYSTSYYVGLMVLGALLALIRLYRRNLPGVLGWVVTALLVAGVALSLVRPAWLVVGGQDQTWAFFALAVGIAWFLPRVSVEERTVWLWFGAPMLFMLFFTLTPNTHVYGFFIGWALVVGSVVGTGWQALRARVGLPAARWVGAAAALVLLLVFGNYAYWYFVATDLEVLRTWRENRPRGYWVPYDMPTNMSIFGFPLKNGWKSVGALYAGGVLDAPFALHGKEPVADWYTRGIGQCPRDHVYYLWHESVEPAEQGYNTVVRRQIEEKGYQLYGTATVNGQPRLAIYKLASEPLIPRTFAVEEYEGYFDQELSGPFFEKNGPVAAPVIEHPLDFRFGDHIWLRGYRLTGQDARPGDGVQLTLYWETDAPLDMAYSVFTQIIDRSNAYKAGQRDGEPGCNLFPTDTWRPEDIIADRYYLPLAPDARPGTYTVLIGMYDRESGERVEIYTANGDPVGDALGIDEVRIHVP